MTRTTVSAPFPKDFLCLDTSLSSHSENSYSSFKTQVKCCLLCEAFLVSHLESGLPLPTCFSWHAVPTAVGHFSQEQSRSSDWLVSCMILLECRAGLRFCVFPWSDSRSDTWWINAGWLNWSSVSAGSIFFHLFIPSSNNFLSTYHVASIPSTV